MPGDEKAVHNGSRGLCVRSYRQDECTHEPGVHQALPRQTLPATQQRFRGGGEQPPGKRADLSTRVLHQLPIVDRAE